MFSVLRVKVASGGSGGKPGGIFDSRFRLRLPLSGRFGDAFLLPSSVVVELVLEAPGLLRSEKLTEAAIKAARSRARRRSAFASSLHFSPWSNRLP